MVIKTLFGFFLSHLHLGTTGLHIQTKGQLWPLHRGGNYQFSVWWIHHTVAIVNPLDIKLVNLTSVEWSKMHPYFFHISYQNHQGHIFRNTLKIIAVKNSAPKPIPFIWDFFFKDSIDFWCWKMTLKIRILQSLVGIKNKLCTRFINADGRRFKFRLISLIPFYFENRILIYLANNEKKYVYKESCFLLLCILGPLYLCWFLAVGPFKLRKKLLFSLKMTTLTIFAQ